MQQAARPLVSCDASNRLEVTTRDLVVLANIYYSVISESKFLEGTPFWRIRVQRFRGPICVALHRLLHAVSVELHLLLICHTLLERLQQSVSRCIRAGSTWVRFHQL